MANRIERTDDEWRRKLTPEQYRVTRQKGTEPAFTGKYWNCHEDGIYLCVCCGADLFSSDTKYDSGTGWPSFYEPMRPENIEQTVESRLFRRRTEVHCSRCGAHLGHVFGDGPAPTGLRYCINSTSLELKKRS